MPRELSTRAAGFEAAFAALLSAKREATAEIGREAAAILQAVRERGDAALAELTRRFDRFDPAAAGFAIGPAEVARARAAVPKETLAALELAAERIEAFHARQRPEDFLYEDGLGVRLGQRWTPIDAVGLYVPGGTAAYPSSVLMNALPARVAGVPRRVMCVPTPEGQVAPLVLAAAHLAGVEEIYRVGGAQAVAALAYGTETIRPVDKIVGPGNAWVAAAKRQVFGQVGIDAIAGPSEVLVLADAENDPDWIAADLLSQAEHDTAAQAVLVSTDVAFLARVGMAVQVQLQSLPRAAVARASWEQQGALILAASWEEAAALANRMAPEHLELALAEPERLLPLIRHAGAIFLGRHTPEALGDYLAGPNHVLPTARTARFASGLSVLDFLKRSAVVACPPSALARLAPAAIRLAEAEGLEAHARSLALRLKSRDG
jgi:histidinol dehydrogenase